MHGAPSAAALALAEALERAYRLALQLDDAGSLTVVAELREVLDDARARSIAVLSGAPPLPAAVKPQPNGTADAASARPPTPHR